MKYFQLAIDVPGTLGLAKENALAMIIFTRRNHHRTSHTKMLYGRSSFGG